MTGSIIRTAFEEVASHITNIDTVRVIVDELDSKNLSTGDVIEMLQKKMEEAEVTLKTDIRILINECRHLESRKHS